MRLTLSCLDSPIGPLAVATDAEGSLRGLSFAGHDMEPLRRSMRREYPGSELGDGDAPPSAHQAIVAYFAGDREALRRAPWSLNGAMAGDGFHARIWRALTEIPAGQTISYGEIARRVGQPGAAQAAGVALNRNPLPLVLPCHRVVGADGAMVGFGGGLERKTWLLRHEGTLLI